ncbi:S9 family peptidase [Allorhodopirellula solitaria]|uniref:Prolyl tripeptidyl peptidase n=1 Tax=Allorhodopirellula solitaria TaxID=2527987 RepID=A0A5C5XPA1_9BACT|nr:DPP IV N-terminal domain-containing protein [Allorhodopirellula solitaria]TWT64734.1 Prolyl tripeptidyl peptidase precursor [Allorhodopirellula solitaria]
MKTTRMELLLVGCLCPLLLLCQDMAVAAAPPSRGGGPPLPPALAERTTLSLARIYHGPDFNLQQESIRWDARQNVLWSLRDNDAGHPEIIRRSIPEGKETVAVSADQFRLPSGERISIDQYRWSPDHQYLLVFTNSVRVWRSHTRGDYWLLDLISKSWRKLGGEEAANQSLMFATFSPQGDKIAYVRDRHLYWESTASGEVDAIAASDEPNLIEGTFDWVYEEELKLTRGFQFSPNGEKIAFWQLDESEVPVHSLIDNTSERYPIIKQFAYPKVGQTNSAAKIGIFHFDDAQTTWLRIAGDPRQHYLAALRWLPAESPGSNERLLVQQLNRPQNANRLWLCDASSGDCVVLLKETSPGWVMRQANMPLLPQQESGPSAGVRRETVDLIWLSERSGWRHLYRAAIMPWLLTSPIDTSEVLDDANTHRGVQLDPITTGAWDVIDLDAVSQTTGDLFFTASPDDAAARALYMCASNREQPNAHPSRVSPEKEGTFEYRISPTGQFALETWSDISTPPVERLVHLDAYQRIEVLHDNATCRAAIEALRPIEQQFISLQIDDQESLDAWIMLPQSSGNADATGSRHSVPLVLHVYAEPAGQTVRDRYLGRTYLWHRYLTQLGFAVATIDARGSASPRGREFRQSVYGKIGILPPADQAAGVQQLLKRFPQLAPDRVGVWGWSGGGSTTLHSLFRYPELYAAGIAVAPVSDQLDYDTIYQERYMGLVEDDRQPFVEGSPLTHAEGLADPLLLIHGTGDDNVHFASTERLINRLVALGKQFDMMSYPGRSHSISEGEGTVMHLHQLMTNFFLETLHPGD